MITKPILAASIIPDTAKITRPSYQGHFSDIVFPVICTEKVDGIRAFKSNGRLLSRKGLPIPNDHVRSIIEATCPNGWDGEIIVPGKSFNETQSAIMTVKGRPSFVWRVFDRVGPEPSVPYEIRLKQLEEEVFNNPNVYGTAEMIPYVYCHNVNDIVAFETKCLENGHEGICGRSLASPYKPGRSTISEGYLWKMKRFLDSEATVIGFQPLLHNENEQVLDELGFAKRSKSIAGLIEVAMLGKLSVHHPVFGNFNIGSGFTLQQREEIWRNPTAYLNKTVTFKYQPYGMKEGGKPRAPIFKGFRLE